MHTPDDVPFADRTAAGRRLARELRGEAHDEAVVVGLARGGAVVAAEVARALDLPFDVVAVRKIGHPWEPEYALGAAAPGADGVYVRAAGGLSDADLAAIVARTKADADALDRRLHARRQALDLTGHTVLLVDDGLATGASMTAAVQWARGRGASRVVVAVPAAAATSAEELRKEADAVVCVHEAYDFGAVGWWFERFEQVDDETVLRLLDESLARGAAPA